MSERDVLTRERRALALAAALAMRALSAGVKHDPRRRGTIYALKAELLAAFWRAGYCTAASVEAPQLWAFTFVVEGWRFQWHLPANRVRFRARVFSIPSDAVALPPYPDTTQSRINAVRRYLRHVGG